MKRLLGIFCLVVFFFFSPSFFASDATPTPTLTDLSKIQVNYDLPYPGILPDSPFYPLKTFRDKIVSFLITDAYKQAEFDLLQADKRLVAGQYMLQEGNHNDVLISQTLSKGENYFDNAITNIQQAKEEGRLVNDFLDRLTRASLKHQQVLYGMMQQSHGQLRADIASQIKRVQNMQEKVNALKPHNK